MADDPTTLPKDEKRGGEEILIVMKMICATTYLNKLVLAMIYTTVRFFIEIHINNRPYKI